MPDGLLLKIAGGSLAGVLALIAIAIVTAQAIHAPSHPASRNTHHLGLLNHLPQSPPLSMYVYSQVSFSPI